jgi:hypothetical protein
MSFGFDIRSPALAAKWVANVKSTPLVQQLQDNSRAKHENDLQQSLRGKYSIESAHSEILLKGVGR